MSWPPSGLPVSATPRLGRHGGRRWAGVAAFVIAGIAGTLLGAQLWPSSGSDTMARSAIDASAYFALDGGKPTAFPDSRLGLGAFSLDGPVAPVAALLGEPTGRQHDLGGSMATWSLPGGASFHVTTWQGTDRIAALQAEVPPGSRVAVAAFGGVVVGRSSLSEVVSAWGLGYSAATSRSDDYAVSYVECVGPLPVVVKFDQAARSSARSSALGTVLWDAPVTRMLIAYADEAPGSDGCR